MAETTPIIPKVTRTSASVNAGLGAAKLPPPRALHAEMTVLR